MAKRSANIPESERLRALRAYPLPSGSSQRLDRIARLAAQVCGAPIGLVSIIEESEMIFIGKDGFDRCGAPREHAFCAHAMFGDDVMIVRDARADVRFADNPLVTGDPHIRFYAGYPLVSPEGVPLGAVCVIDRAPRDGLSDEQLVALETLTDLALMTMEDHRVRAVNDAAQSLSQSQVAELEQRFAVLADSLPQMVWSTPPDGQSDYFNHQWCEFTGQSAEASYGVGWLGFLHPEDAPIAAKAWTDAVGAGESYEVRYRMRRHDGAHRWVIARGLPLFNDAGKVVRWIGTCTDIHDELAAADALELLSQELSHRIKNIFAVLGGLVSLSSRHHPDAAEFAHELYSRILALGRAHSFIGSPGSRSSHAGEGNLKGLLAELLEPYLASGSERLIITGDDVRIDDRSATPLALVFHELMTNSAKYGAITSETGTVEIALENADPVRLRWIERGVVGLAPEQQSGGGGFGSRLIDMSITRQLGGEYQRNWNAEGMEIVITVPRGNLDRD